MIKNQFDSYLACEEWLDDLESAREAFFDRLPYTGIPGISYEEFTSNNSLTHDARMAVVADEMKKYDDDHKFIKSMCLDIMANCRYLLDQIEDEETKEMCRKKYFEKKKIVKEVAEEVGFERTTVGKRMGKAFRKIIKIE